MASSLKFKPRPVEVKATQWMQPGDHRWVRSGSKYKNGGVWQYVIEPSKPNRNLGPWLPVSVITDADSTYIEVASGDWLIERGDDIEVLSDTQFRSLYAPVDASLEGPSDLRVAEAISLLRVLVQFAYEQGFHECGYDPIDLILAAGDLDSTHKAGGYTTQTKMLPAPDYEIPGRSPPRAKLHDRKECRLNLTGVSAYGATLAHLLAALLEKHGHLAGEPPDLEALLTAARTATDSSVTGSSTTVSLTASEASSLGQAWVMTVPVISTGHLTKATNEMLLEAGDTLNWMICATYEEGYFLSVPDEEVLDELQPPPRDLVEIWAWARAKKFGWVRLDSSGDAIDELPSYDW